jgi:hypothetical protein
LVELKFAAAVNARSDAGDRDILLRLFVAGWHPKVLASDQLLFRWLFERATFRAVMKSGMVPDWKSWLGFVKSRKVQFVNAVGPHGTTVATLGTDPAEIDAAFARVEALLGELLKE